jgi:SRSO17 transposase
LALELITPLHGVLPHAWVTFDEGYGRDTAFVAGQEDLGERYIGEVPRDTRGWLERPAVQLPGPGKGRPRTKPRVDPHAANPQTVEEIAASLPGDAWQRLAFRQGSKGKQPGYFAARSWVPVRDELPGPEMWLVWERSCDQEPKAKYYVSNAGVSCSLLEMAQGGHRRYPVEECFLGGKDELGLGDYEVQGWRGWQHHQRLVMLAMWFLLLWGRQVGGKSGDGMTLPDAWRLLQTVLATALWGCPRERAIRLSAWRQRRNRIAGECHAKTRRRASRKRLRNTG